MAVLDDVVALELALLDPETRSRPDEVERLLHQDFREIGASGRVWDRASIVAALADAPGTGARASDVEARFVASDLVLVTYQAESAAGRSQRSSLWTRDGGGWQVLFHQGTYVTEPPGEAPTLRGDPPELVLRPLAPGDEAELRRIRASDGVARWWHPPEDDFPWEDEPAVTRLTIEFDGAVAGMVQFLEDLDPAYRQSSIDLYLDPALHGHGLGTEVVRRVARHLIDVRGHHRVTLDPAAANAAAIRAYEKVGFKPVGVLRRYERDVDGPGWHDGLLMELLAE
jgi:aminoglycoside 6'-N-acetyltransferase